MLDEKEQGRMAKTLDHPVRKRIIDLLGENGPLSWKELSGRLGIATGALYYHIDALEGIVSRDSEKKYVLTSKGEKIYDYLQNHPSTSPQALARTLGRKGGVDWIRMVFTPRGLIQHVGSAKRNSLIATFLICGVLLLDLLLGRTTSYLYFMAPVSSGWVSVGGFLLSLAALVVIASLSSRLLFKVRLNYPALIFGVSLSFVPSAAFGTLSRILPDVGAIGTLATVVLVFFQTWSATILASAVSVASAVRIETAMLIGLAVLYLTVVLMLLAAGIV